MILSLIAAASEDNVIGNKGKLPWILPADLRHFRAITESCPVIMGRKTFESIGHPLPRRRNIVITRQRDFKLEGCDVVGSLQEALKASEANEAQEAFIIGGAEIYRQAFPLAHRIYLTRVHTEVAGDTFFPEVEGSEWRKVSCEHHEADAENPFPYTFLLYERKK